VRVLLILALGLVGSICGCSNKPDIDGARAVPGQLSSALNDGSVDQLKTTLADDAVLVRGNARALVGRDAIAGYYDGAFRQIEYKISFSSETLESAGELAIDRGRFEGTLKSTDGKASVPVSGEYFHVLKDEPGSGWKIWRGTWTFATPLEATSCQDTGARSCCCKDIGGNDCVARPNDGCSSTYPVPILLP